MTHELDAEIQTLTAKLRGLRARRAADVIPARNRRELKRQCAHRHIDNFKVSAHEWKCSVCGTESVWRPSFRYFGCISCRRCKAEPAIEAVVCSDKCRQAFEKASANANDSESVTPIRKGQR